MKHIEDGDPMTPEELYALQGLELSDFEDDGNTMTGEEFNRLVDEVQYVSDFIPTENKPKARPRQQPEKHFQAMVQILAKDNGWLDWHVLSSKGMRAGFPDLVLIRPPEIIWVELKAENGRVTPAQKEMHELLRECGQRVYLWIDSNASTETWEEILEVLK